MEIRFQAIYIPEVNITDAQMAERAGITANLSRGNASPVSESFIFEKPSEELVTVMRLATKKIPFAYIPLRPDANAHSECVNPFMQERLDEIRQALAEHMDTMV